jgi:hypothetical protein
MVRGVATAVRYAAWAAHVRTERDVDRCRTVRVICALRCSDMDVVLLIPWRVELVCLDAATRFAVASRAQYCCIRLEYGRSCAHRVLDLSRNQLIGSIPSALGSLTSIL